MNTQKKIFTSILLFVLSPLIGQTNSGYNMLGNYARNITDSTEIETKLMPSSIYELGEKQNSTENENEQKQTITPDYAISNSFEVGATPGVINVTATGAATYKIPIEVPKGVANFEPALSVDYNSQSGNGLLGYGWNLTAFSTISRSGKTFYFDNTTGAAELSNSDNLMLDGQRLLLISGQNLVNGAKYRLEYDPFTDIAFKKVNNFQSFVVRTKDGVIREFGSTTDSNIDVSGGKILYWLLSKVTDINGNVITYTYNKIAQSGEFYITKIQYAGNRRVEFSYETRKDIIESYFAGIMLKNSKILKSISTYINQTRVKKYDFNNQYNGFYSKLTEIIEFGQNNKHYNSTLVNYTDQGVSGREYVTRLSVKRQGDKPLLADFNGDGRTDFLSYPEKKSYDSSDVATLYLSVDDAGEVGFKVKCTIPMQFTYGVFDRFILADLNGDGKMDVVNVSKALNGTYRYNFYIFDGENLTYNSKGFNTDGNEALAADFNGDGKQEILVFSNQQVFNGEGNQIASGGLKDLGSIFIPEYPNNKYICDLTGNGKMNIIAMNSEGGWAYELSGNSFVRLNGFDSPNLKNYNYPYFGDFNGDGKTDILIQKNVTDHNYDDVSILFSTGNGFVKKQITNANIRSKVQVADFNNDGKSDIFHMEIVNNAVRMKVGLFNGTNFTTSFYSTNAQPSTFDVAYEYDSYFFQLGDFDGDGRAEFGNLRYADFYLIHTFNDALNLPVKSITNGLGEQTSFEYGPITNNMVCSNQGNNVSYPVAGSLFPLYVVKRMTHSGKGYSEDIAYNYKNPRMHRQGKGFLGFEEIVIENSSKDRKVTATYNINNIYYYPFVTKEKVTTRAGTNISLSEYQNAIVNLGTKRVCPYVKKQTDTDYLTGIVRSTECTQVDSWGNPLTVVTKYGNDVTETVTSTYTNIGTDDKWVFSLPVTVIKTTTKGSSNWVEKQVQEYNKQYLVSKSVFYTYDGANKVSENTFNYDSFGNLLNTTSRAYSSATGLTTAYEYSQDGVFQTKMTDPLLLSTRWNYNSLGLINSSIDPYNKTISYQYDDMGRLKEKKYPDNTISTTSFSWGGSVTNSVYYITESTTGKPVAKQYFDCINRELRASSTRYNGNDIHCDTKYDNAGRIYQKSLPFGTGAARWNTYKYDTYGRISQIAHASGKIESYAYSKNTITANSNGISSKNTFNAKGELIKVEDPAGSIVYNLRPDGQPVSIVAPGNVTTSFVYDNYGRRTQINDPSAGLKKYTYYADGTLKEETDADNRRKTMTYDQYKRIRTKVLPEFTTTYSYDPKGNLMSESSTNGTSHTYTYDSYGRLDKDTDFGPDGKWLEKTRAYTNGNLASIVFKSQTETMGTENYIYTNGHLSEIKFGSTSVWKITAENDMGLPTKVVSGPVTCSYSYNNFGFKTGESSASNNSGTFQNFTYGFDLTKGNLLNRVDVKRTKTENFTYDNLNRLLTYSGKTMGYDAKGNITRKTDISNTFSYGNSSKPYAISSIDLGANTSIPAKNQTVNYTSFERPAIISENNYEAAFTYDGNGSRKKMLLKRNGSTMVQRYYLGNRYEFDSDKQKLFIGGDAYSASAVYVKQGSSWSLYYLCRDNLGSITHIVNSNGSLAYEYSYDAWGRLRNPSTQSVYPPDSEPGLFLDRGYTGHEHLSMFGLINMNSRLYDPAIGRFLSPDPFVQASDFSQNYNRYSYCLNNPLKYTDPNGEFWHLIIGAAIGGVVNWASNGFRFDAKGLGYFGVGAVAGALGAGVGAGISSAMASGSFGAGFIGSSAAMTATSSFVTGAAIGGGAGFSSGFTTGLGNGLLDGQNFGQALWSGTKGGLIGGASGALLGGLWSGIDAARDGRDFWGGKPWQTVTDYSLPNGNLPIHQQANPEVGCTQETLESISDYLERPVNVANMNQGEDFAQLANQYGFNTKTVMPGTANSEHIVGAQLNIGNPSAITYSNGGTMHTVGLNRIQMQQVPRVLGSGFRTRILIQVMDPLHSTYQNLSTSLFRSGYIRVVIP